MKKFLLAIVVFSLSSISGSKLHAQPAKVGAWYQYFGNQKISSRWNWHNEVQYRNFNKGGDLEQLLLRTGFGYNLTPGNNNVLLGYGFINAASYNSLSQKSFKEEHRIFQQYIYTHKLSKIYLQHRVRVEERFVEKDFSMRYRYLLGARIGLTDAVIAKNSLYLSLYNEIFIKHTGNFPERNRLYGALGFVPHKDIRIEAGYLRQMIKDNSRSQFQLALFNNLKW